MKGQILDFSFQTNSGVVMGDDGSRYSFTGAEWQGSEFPTAGMRVDFMPEGSDATSVQVDVAPAGVGQVPSQSSAPLSGIGAVPVGQWLETAKTVGGNVFTRAMAIARSIPTLYLIIGGAVAGVLVVAIVVLSVLSATGVIGGGNPKPMSALDLVPGDTRSVIRMDVQKILADDYLADEWELDDFVDLDDLGVHPDDLSEIVIADDWDADGVVVLKGSFNLDDIRDEFVDQDGEEETYRGYEVWEDLYGGGAAALLDSYVVMSNSVRAVEGVLKNLYSGSGSLERADQDNEMKQILDEIGGGFVVYAKAGGSCGVANCEGYGYVFTEVDHEVEESKIEIAFLFRNERAAERAADDYDDVADFLEYADDIDIEDTEANGRFVTGVAYEDF